ncbi:hypothetical protein ADUPG1_009126 [Aduncisulcus paluster]|uniref:Uncharacterized protein n=1 Tax=Aduncisulcus paluster TaxID=2918883 RepID=A0ABQ5KUG9_9EUKA|nr:hypothetical protein ADUPG1_009126 [Aduncisulcus paluster]
MRQQAHDVLFSRSKGSKPRLSDLWAKYKDSLRKSSSSTQQNGESLTSPSEKTALEDRDISASFFALSAKISASAKAPIKEPFLSSPRLSIRDSLQSPLLSSRRKERISYPTFSTSKAELHRSALDSRSSQECQRPLEASVEGSEEREAHEVRASPLDGNESGPFHHFLFSNPRIPPNKVQTAVKQSSSKKSSAPPCKKSSSSSSHAAIDSRRQHPTGQSDKGGVSAPIKSISKGYKGDHQQQQESRHHAGPVGDESGDGEGESIGFSETETSSFPHSGVSNAHVSASGTEISGQAGRKLMFDSDTLSSFETQSCDNVTLFRLLDLAKIDLTLLRATVVRMFHICRENGVELDDDIMQVVTSIQESCTEDNQISSGTSESTP